jgi:hypothetical protein
MGHIVEAHKCRRQAGGDNRDIQGLAIDTRSAIVDKPKRWLVHHDTRR